MFALNIEKLYLFLCYAISDIEQALNACQPQTLKFQIIFK